MWSPQIFKINGQEQLVSPSAEATIAYNPENGSEIWRVTHGGMNGSLRPLFAHGMMYLTTYSGGIQLFAFKPEGTGEQKKNIAWKQEKGAAKRSSPLIVGDRIYMASDDKILSCVDANGTSRSMCPAIVIANSASSLELVVSMTQSDRDFIRRASSRNSDSPFGVMRPLASRSCFSGSVSRTV